jgi:hypothetical protein
MGDSFYILGSLRLYNGDPPNLRSPTLVMSLHPITITYLSRVPHCPSHAHSSQFSSSQGRSYGSEGFVDLVN